MKMCGTNLAFLTGLFIVLGCSAMSQADTSVGGPMVSDAHWTLAGGPYNVYESIHIGAGAVLTIDPGVEVRFDPGKNMTVAQGGLLARGTLTLPIRFTTTAPDPVADEYPWAGIVFEDGTLDAGFDEEGNYAHGSVIDYTVFEHVAADAVIRMDSAAPYIAHSIIQNNSAGHGVDAWHADGLRLRGNAVSGNASAGLNLRVSNQVTLTGNTSMHNGASGVSLYICNDATLIGNTMARNAGGVSLTNADFAILAGERILHNTDFAIQVGSASDRLVVSADPQNPTWVFSDAATQVINANSFGQSFLPEGKGNVDARHVWWGAVDEADIQAGILDFWDDETYGIVFYDPWASLVGDLNGDGFVGQNDLDIVLANWCNTPPIDLRADPSGDSLVGQTDLDAVLVAWGLAASPAQSAPEPATVSLLALGGLAAIRPKRQ